MRNAFISEVIRLALEDDRVFLVTGDLGYSVLEPFRDQFPERFLNVGVAEQNMIGVATGLAREGYTVFTYSIGNFATLRCLEQIRYDVAYHQANVKIVAVGGGYAYGSQGVSHHLTEDYGVLGSIPNLTLCSPADALEARLTARYCVESNGPTYVRLNKAGERDVHDRDITGDFQKGRFINVRDGEETLVLVTGSIARRALDEMERYQLPWALWTSPFIGTYSSQDVETICSRFQVVICLEENQRRNGFGASFLECLNDEQAVNPGLQVPQVIRVAIPNIFQGRAGSQDHLRDNAGLTLRDIRVGLA